MDCEHHQEWTNHKNNKCQKKIQVFQRQEQANLLTVKNIFHLPKIPFFCRRLFQACRCKEILKNKQNNKKAIKINFTFIASVLLHLMNIKLLKIN